LEPLIVSALKLGKDWKKNGKESALYASVDATVTEYILSFASQFDGGARNPANMQKALAAAQTMLGTKEFDAMTVGFSLFKDTERMTEIELAKAHKFLSSDLGMEAVYNNDLSQVFVVSGNVNEALLKLDQIAAGDKKTLKEKYGITQPLTGNFRSQPGTPGEISGEMEFIDTKGNRYKVDSAKDDTLQGFIYNAQNKTWNPLTQRTGLNTGKDFTMPFPKGMLKTGIMGELKYTPKTGKLSPIEEAQEAEKAAAEAARSEKYDMTEAEWDKLPYDQKYAIWTRNKFKLEEIPLPSQIKGQGLKP